MAISLLFRASSYLVCVACVPLTLTQWGRASMDSTTERMDTASAAEAMGLLFSHGINQGIAYFLNYGLKYIWVLVLIGIAWDSSPPWWFDPENRRILEETRQKFQLMAVQGPCWRIGFWDSQCRGPRRCEGGLVRNLHHFVHAHCLRQYVILGRGPSRQGTHRES